MTRMFEDVIPTMNDELSQTMDGRSDLEDGQVIRDLVELFDKTRKRPVLDIDRRTLNVQAAIQYMVPRLNIRLDVITGVVNITASDSQADQTWNQLYRGTDWYEGMDNRLFEQVLASLLTPQIGR